MRKSVLGIMVALLVLGAGQIGAQEKVKAPKVEVPEVFTITGEFVRIAYNNEGWVTLGYRVANDSQGDEWLMVEVGVTLRKPTKNQTLTRDSFSLMLPDGGTIGLATQEEYQKAGYLRALNTRANMVRDSINYFPVEANQACLLGFFSDPTSGARALSFDQFEVSWQRACRGRLFFKVPGKIATGQYYLNAKFGESMVQVPFRIMTKEEQKYLHKNWKDLKKEHEAELKK